MGAWKSCDVCHFYPRSPCGERLAAMRLSVRQFRFLSTLSLRRATGCLSSILIVLPHFYPRSPCGERRCAGRPRSGWKDISIHALLAESDRGCGWRHCILFRFLSTLSLRRATAKRWNSTERPVISIHALLAESDLPTDGLFFIVGRFLSTLSLRRATWVLVSMICLPLDFYPRSPCGERRL